MKKWADTYTIDTQRISVRYTCPQCGHENKIDIEDFSSDTDYLYDNVQRYKKCDNCNSEARYTLEVKVGFCLQADEPQKDLVHPDQLRLFTE